jgi:hypothetical protein
MREMGKRWLVTLSLLWMLILALFSFEIGAGTTVRAKSSPVVSCVPWSSGQRWSLERCADENDEIVCILASSGMMSCKFEQ